jgi:hypothetical protein
MTWLLLFVGVVAALLWLAQVLASALYDIRAAQMRPRPLRVRPLVSVIILTNGDPIGDCLRSVQASSYRKRELMVIANGSANSAALRKELAGRGRLMVKRRPVDRAAAILAAQRYVHGKIVLLLDTSARLDRTTIDQAVSQFDRHSSAAWLLPDIRIAANSVSSTFQGYAGLVATCTNKLRSLLHLPLMFDGPAVFCRRVDLSRQLRRGDLPGTFTADVPVTVTGAGSLIQWWRQQYAAQAYRWQRFVRSQTWQAAMSDALPLLLAVLAPVLLGYALYLGIDLQQTWLLGLGLIAVIVVAINAIWDSSGLRFKQKLSYLAGIPLVVGFGTLALAASALNHLMLFAQLIRRRLDEVAA